MREAVHPVKGPQPENVPMVSIRKSRGARLIRHPKVQKSARLEDTRAITKSRPPIRQVLEDVVGDNPVEVLVRPRIRGHVQVPTHVGLPVEVDVDPLDAVRRVNLAVAAAEVEKPRPYRLRIILSHCRAISDHL